MAARTSALTWLQPLAMPGAQFSTGGLYRDSPVIDIGGTGSFISTASTGTR